MDKILLLGGTGAMGSFLVEILSKKYDLYVTTRKKRRSSEYIHYIVGNAYDTDFLTSILEKCHYKAIVDFMNYSTEHYSRRVDMLLEATDQLFFISSARVYANSCTPIRETNLRLLDMSLDRKFLDTDDYALAKAKQEDILRSKEKKNWTIIRPYMTYFSNRLDLGYYSKELWLYRALKGRTVIFTKDVAKSLVTLTYGFDVANGIAALVGKEQALGDTFHITQEKALRWSEVFKIYKQELNNAGFKFKILLLDHPKIDGGYIYHYDRLYDRVFDNTKINQYVDTSTFISPEIGIRRCVREFVKSPQFNGIDWKKQAFWDSIVEEHAYRDEFLTIKDYVIYLIFRYCISYSLTKKIYQIIKK